MFTCYLSPLWKLLLGRPLKMLRLCLGTSWCDLLLFSRYKFLVSHTFKSGSSRWSEICSWVEVMRFIDQHVEYMCRELWNICVPTVPCRSLLFSSMFSLSLETKCNFCMLVCMGPLHCGNKHHLSWFSIGLPEHFTNPLSLSPTPSIIDVYGLWNKE